MVKQLSLILGAMTIVFSVVLSIGSAVFVFYLAAQETDKYIHAALFFGGALFLLIGFAGFLAGLVGLFGSALLKASETVEIEPAQQAEA